MPGPMPDASELPGGRSHPRVSVFSVREQLSPARMEANQGILRQLGLALRLKGSGFRVGSSAVFAAAPSLYSCDILHVPYRWRKAGLWKSRRKEKRRPSLILMLMLMLMCMILCMCT
jgi:hypothetical protein